MTPARPVPAVRAPPWLGRSPGITPRQFESDDLMLDQLCLNQALSTKLIHMARRKVPIMRSNISRAVLVAAAATGIWALGNVAANAATLPSVPSTDGLTTVTHTLGTPTGAVGG